MSPQTARSTSIALVGGMGAALFFSQGLLVWAAFIAWAAMLEAGGDTAALRQTVAGTAFGACMAWVALAINFSMSVPAESWLWIPRESTAIALTLFLVVLATRFEPLSRLSTSLYGYAAMFGAMAVRVESVTSLERLSGFHLYNPLILVVLSMTGGAVFGLASNKLAGALTTK